MTVTHWGYWDEPVFGRGRYAWQRALCGAHYTRAELSTEPTCPVCARRLAELDAEDEQKTPSSTTF